ncbi:hypothetical protein LZ554_004349 [Drepanopeziza brunnea f. sp. 'monogermtubi']|nr:hypothetical protein LZ554_004349 [Drepanopeziza brunnea f. sp. 'monogermtubi']
MCYRVSSEPPSPPPRAALSQLEQQGLPGAGSSAEGHMRPDEAQGFSRDEHRVVLGCGARARQVDDGGDERVDDEGHERSEGGAHLGIGELLVCGSSERVHAAGGEGGLVEGAGASFMIRVKAGEVAAKGIELVSFGPLLLPPHAALS